jgi:hypothetical protein
VGGAGRFTCVIREHFKLGDGGEGLESWTRSSVLSVFEVPHGVEQFTKELGPTSVEDCLTSPASTSIL